jgi:hypothetical protein
MPEKHHNQYTIRRVPDRVDQLLREKAEQCGTSLNEAALSALSSGLGVEGGGVIYNDLDDLAGTWVQDNAFDRAMKEMDTLDEGLWK